MYVVQIKAYQILSPPGLDPLSAILSASKKLTSWCILSFCWFNLRTLQSWVILTVVLKERPAVMLMLFTQMSVWRIRAHLPPALLLGSGWPSPGPIHWAAQPRPCVLNGTHIEWPETARRVSWAPPAPHSETLSPAYRITVRKLCHFHSQNMAETEGGATEGFTLTANIFMSSSCSSFSDRLCPSSSIS